MSWSVVTAPSDAAPPNPLTMRAQTILPRHQFPEHAHDWHQLVYAIQGVLTVSTAGQTLGICEGQALELLTWAPSIRNGAPSTIRA